MIYKFLFACICICLYRGVAGAFEASYYSDDLEGAMSSNGTIFSQSGHTAAICYEDLSQLAYVSTAQTGMVITLTDRPNCSQHTDRVDLSSSVFSTFAPLSQGIIRDISVVPLGIKTAKFIKRNILPDDFQDYSIELSAPIPNTFFAGESIKIQGRVLNGKKQVAIFLKNKNTSEKYTQSYLVDSRGMFDIVFTLPKNLGEYFFKIISISAGEELLIKDFKEIFVIESSIIDLYPKNTNVNLKNSSLKQSSVINKPFTTNKNTVIELDKNMWGQFLLVQEGKKSITQGQILSFSGMDLSYGHASYVLTGHTISSSSSLDISPIPTYYSSGKIFIDRVRRSTSEGIVNIRKIGKIANFQFRVQKGYDIQPKYYVTSPRGDVQEYSISKKFIDTRGFLRNDILIKGSFPIDDNGTYRFEVNKNSGIAYINVPFYTRLTLPIIEKDFTLLQGESYRSKILSSINSLRSSLTRTELIIDNELSRIAELKAKDMFLTNSGTNLGVSHANSKGKDIRVFAEFYGVKRNIFGENVAGSNNITQTAILELQDGLEESPIHRNNMISSNFSKIGIGYYQKDGFSYLVHIFSN